MNATVILLLVVVFSFVVGRFVTRYASRWVTPSGAEYLLFGVLVGPAMWPRPISVEELAKLGPFVSLVIGLVGFLVGLRLRKSVRGVEAVVASTVTAAIVIAVVAAATATAAIVFGWFPAESDFLIEHNFAIRQGWELEVRATEQTGYLAVILGSCAAVTSTTINEAVQRVTGASGRLTELTRTFSHVTSTVAILAFGFALATGRAAESASRFGIGVTEWALLSIGVAVACGLSFLLFMGKDSDRSRIFLGSVGAVTFAAGIGSALGISPLFVNLIAGITVGATSAHADRVLSELDRLQQPLFALLMILAGALWTPPEASAWLLPLGYVAMRLVLWRVVSRSAVFLLVENPPRLSRLGNCFSGQGVLAVAIAVSGAQRFPELSGTLLTVVLFAVLASDLFSERSLRAQLLDAGEIAPPESRAAGEAPKSAPPTARTGRARTAPVLNKGEGEPQ